MASGAARHAPSGVVELASHLQCLVVEAAVAQSGSSIGTLRLVSRDWRAHADTCYSCLVPKSGDAAQIAAFLCHGKHPQIALDLTRHPGMAIEVPSRLLLVQMETAVQIRQRLSILKEVAPGGLVLRAGLRTLSHTPMYHELLRLQLGPLLKGLHLFNDYSYEENAAQPPPVEHELMPPGLRLPLCRLWRILHTFGVVQGGISELVLDHVQLGDITPFLPVLEDMTSLTRLELRGTELRQVPEGVSALTTLTALVLDNTHMKVRGGLVFKHLPKSLQVLQATHSHVALNIKPHDLRRLKHLVSLDLSHNKLGAVSSALGGLSRLTHLDLSHNSLVSVPDSMCDLPQLRTLHLQHNKLRVLPPGIGCIFWLEYLDVSYNAIIKPPFGLAQAQKLRYLDLRGNPAMDLSFLRGTLLHTRLRAMLAAAEQRVHASAATAQVAGAGAGEAGPSRGVQQARGSEDRLLFMADESFLKAVREH